MTLPEWPDIKKYGVPGGSGNKPSGNERGVALIQWGQSQLQEEILYERARADAAIARLRVAVDLLTRMSGMVHPITQRDIDDFFRDIGPIPGDTP